MISVSPTSQIPIISKKQSWLLAYLEAPIELRYTANPLNSDKSFKFAIGVKVGLMINAHTRNKTLQTKVALLSMIM